MRFVRLVVIPLLWMCVGGAVVFFCFSRTSTQNRPPPGPPIRSIALENSGDGFRVLSPEIMPLVPVLRVVDGDTAEILWQDKPTFLRYYGVNTTERGDPCYQEGRRRNQELSGGAIRLAFDERQIDTHGRLLAYVFTETGESIDARLVAEGIGKAWKRDGFLKEHLMALETDARQARRGCLWSDDNPKPKPKKKTRKKRSPHETFR